MKSKQWVYIAAPYRIPDPIANTQRVIRVAEKVLRLGYVPIVPHLSLLFHLISPHEEQFWLDYDLELLKRCDIILRLEGESLGADNEVVKAHEWGKVFWSESYFASLEAL